MYIFGVVWYICVKKYWQTLAYLANYLRTCSSNLNQTFGFDRQMGGYDLDSFIASAMPPLNFCGLAKFSRNCKCCQPANYFRCSQKYNELLQSYNIKSANAVH